MSVLAGEIQFAAQNLCVWPPWSPQHYNRYLQSGFVGETYDSLGTAFGVGVGVPSARFSLWVGRVRTPMISGRIKQAFWDDRKTVMCDSPRISVRFS